MPWIANLVGPPLISTQLQFHLMNLKRPGLESLVVPAPILKAMKRVVTVPIYWFSKLFCSLDTKMPLAK